MLHIVHASRGKKYFVEAKDSPQAVRILNAVGIDTVGAIADPYAHSTPHGVRIYTPEDASIPVLGGTYILKFKDETGWVEVATCKFGPFWSEMYQTAVRQYGEENVSYSFVRDAELVTA